MCKSTREIRAWCIGWGRVVIGITVLVMCIQAPVVGAEEGKKYQGKVVYEKTILGKAYRIETVEGEPGKYRVSWGEEELKWEPKPWYDDELNKKGPLLYTEWLQPLYYPYTIPLEEREKFNGFDVMDICFPWWPASPGFAAEDGFDGHLYAPGAEYRRDKTGFEWNTYYTKAEDKNWLWDPSPPPSLDGQAYRKYLFLFRSPRDLLKVGFLQIQYQGKNKEDDNYLYVPTVRKVRRLATANRQDSIGGLIIRQEQNAIMTPIHNYKVIGARLMNYPAEDPFFGLDAGEAEKQSPAVEVKRVDGIGGPVWVVETIPFREDWWFAKQLTYVGIATMQPLLQDSFDRNGRLIQRMVPLYSLLPPGQVSKGVPNCCKRETHLFWNALSVKDYMTGFWTLIYSNEQTLNPPIPDGLYNVQSLLQEPKTIDFYRQ